VEAFGTAPKQNLTES